MSEESILRQVAPLLGAVVAFLDTDAVYGAGHDRTVGAKASLQDAFDGLCAGDAAPDRPTLRVVRGGLEAL
jgi:hypothetical protein